MLSAFVALRMGADTEIAEEVATGALLHDTGKVFL
jgi:HD-GYP domain-containing protein (c-di-GMP phosphodiesterase class II)